jgi:DNA polymerase phi
MSSAKKKAKHSKKSGPDQDSTMAARKAKKKDSKPPAVAAPMKDTHDSTEEESIHGDAVMDDAVSDEEIPDIVDKESDEDERPGDVVTEKDNKNDTKKTSKQKDTKPKASTPIPFMDTFYQLSSDESPLRSIAARDLLAHCFFSEDGVNTTDAAYALTRLMNGLCTGRAASRQGFASCLSSFLKVTSSSGDDVLLSILEQDSFGKNLVEEKKGAAEVLRLKLLEVTQYQQTQKEARKAGGKMKGMEGRDHAFGRLFGILAVVRSGVLGLKDFPSSVSCFCTFVAIFVDKGSVLKLHTSQAQKISHMSSAIMMYIPGY